MHALLEQPRPVGALPARAAGTRRRRDHPLGHPGHRLPAHRRERRRGRRRPGAEGRPRRTALRQRQLRRGRLRRPLHLRRAARSEPAPGLRRPRRALLHRREPRPPRGRPHLQRHRRPGARHPAAGASRSDSAAAGSTASRSSGSPTATTQSRRAPSDDGRPARGVRLHRPVPQRGGGSRTTSSGRCAQTAPIHWVEQAPGTFDGMSEESGTGYWAVTKHADVAAISKDSKRLVDVAERRDHPVRGGDAARPDRDAAADPHQPGPARAHATRAGSSPAASRPARSTRSRR